ncbi:MULTISPECIES: squalene/phytoene synthase family protein [Inquilinus]|uniref:Phytoene synthase n=1 Tax=Inquilinus ginsengisoli TaxID=363840 RepID=A0ABU1JXG0_9PROT|nr:squalene/phytoene synthase family protein [Inquilinus ginsengisoli]MDR6293293.1 phytoene synthase [Inquilinus ginsengisoli]
MTVPADRAIADSSPPAGGAPTAVEVAASKTSRQENFPVGSWLLPKALRPHIAAFYRFARTADDIGDDPDLAPAEKLARLDALEAGLTGPGPDSTTAIRASIAATGVGLVDCRDILTAFRRDSENRSCASWDDLIDYCRYSANPVGRYLLRLHGQAESTFPAGDALCTVLQILNHLQDCGDDWRKLRRIYVPTDWIAAAGGIDRFFTADEASARLRRPVLDRCLDLVDAMLDTATTLPGQLTSRPLAAEVSVMLWLARRLAARLRAGDPLLGRVALGKSDFARALRPGLSVMAFGARPLDDATLVRMAVFRAKSSFAAGMRILPPDGRRAIYAVYGFCRQVDDIADSTATVEEKIADLAAWRERLDRIFAGRGEDPLDREMIWAIRRFDLPRAEFDGMLDGMTIDAAAEVRIADRAGLAHYARCVAGTVGVLAVKIFGCPDAASEAFAVAQGEALQLTNILRDVDEDAGLGRLYLPESWLREAGISTDAPIPTIVADPRIAQVCARLAADIVPLYAALPGLMPPGTEKRMKAALIMQHSYRRIFEMLQARGYTDRRVRPRLSKREKLGILLSALLK